MASALVAEAVTAKGLPTFPLWSLTVRSTGAASSSLMMAGSSQLLPTPGKDNPSVLDRQIAQPQLEGLVSFCKMVAQHLHPYYLPQVVDFRLPAMLPPVCIEDNGLAEGYEVPTCSLVGSPSMVTTNPIEDMENETG